MVGNGIMVRNKFFLIYFRNGGLSENSFFEFKFSIRLLGCGIVGKN